MAKQENVPALAPSTEENIKEILLILDKEKTLLSALSRVDKAGKLKTVPADDRHNTEAPFENGEIELDEPTPSRAP